MPSVLTGRELVTDNFYFLRVFGRQYWPWLPVFLAGLIVPWCLRQGDPQRSALSRVWAFSLTVVGVILLGFSLVPKKNNWYTYPYYIGLSLLTAVPLYVFLRNRRVLYRFLVSGAVLVSVGIFILVSIVPEVFRYSRPRLEAIARMGEELRNQKIQIETLQAATDCRHFGLWTYRWQMRYYMKVKEVTCATEPKGIQLVDMREDPSYQRDGSLVLAISYPYVLLDRRAVRGDSERARSK